MSIPSQSPRSAVNSRYNRSRGRRLGRLPMVLILVACAVLAIVFFWSDNGGDNPAKAENQANPAILPPRPQTLAGITPEASDTTPVKPLPAIKPAPVAPEPVKPEPTKPQPTASEPAPEVVEAFEEARRIMPAPRQFTSGQDAVTLYNKGDQLIADGDLVGGRSVLSQLLFDTNLKLSAQDAMVIRNRLTEVNRDLVFSPDIYPDDPITEPYKVDTLLGQIGVKFRVPYQILEIINNTTAPRLQADQTIKVLKGPLHARVIKHQFLMDIYAVAPDGLPVFICSFKVGLGKDDKTPVGSWKVSAASKVKNPGWRDDQTNRWYPPDDPENPIGEYWIAIEGTDDNTKHKRGFGIHGTTEPDSIGREASRGCIRLADEDIKLVFYMLTDHSQGSTVQIVP